MRKIELRSLAEKIAEVEARKVAEVNMTSLRSFNLVYRLERISEESDLLGNYLRLDYHLNIGEHKDLLEHRSLIGLGEVLLRHLSNRLKQQIPIRSENPVRLDYINSGNMNRPVFTYKVPMDIIHYDPMRAPEPPRTYHGMDMRELGEFRLTVPERIKPLTPRGT